MYSWRKLVIYTLFNLTGNKIPVYLKMIKKYDKLSIEEINKIQKDKLKKILLHAYINIPYYYKVLKESNVITGRQVRLENFSNLPILTKEIIRDEDSNLYSKDFKDRKFYKNSSGGSTGEPVRFIQDKEYNEWNIATKIYYKIYGNQKIGERELRLWGSERDTLEGKEKFSIKLKNWLYNRKEFNSFRMTENEMFEFVKGWNKFKPTWIEAYVQSIYEFGKFIKENNLEIHSPKGILVSAGTLYPEMQKLIEQVFSCQTFNRYGTREVGAIACSCKENKGLHLSLFNNYIEILDNQLKPCSSGEIGKVYVTTLNNYSMPLIRYDIGDMAIPTKNEVCS